MTHRETLSWAAGLFDGEGHVGCHPCRTKYPSVQIILNVSQCGDREVLDRFQAAIGLGSIRGPYQRRERPSPEYEYQIGSFEHVQYCICQLWPWLGGVKRRQAVAALKAYVSAPRRWVRFPKNCRQHCSRGHVLSPENSYYDGNGYRSCRECSREKCARAYAKRRAVQTDAKREVTCAGEFP